MRKNRIRNICLIFIVLLGIAPALEAILPINTVRAQTTGAGSTFSIVWITDTQYLPESYPAYFDDLCSWIVSNDQTYNVKMVVHTGDIIDITNDPTQWVNANHSMSILLDNNIPYCWDAGNHDYSGSCWIGDQYLAFNATYLAQEPYWVSSCENGLSTAVHFDVSGQDFLIINIAFDADATPQNGYTLGNPTLNWIQSLLNAYPNSHVIVATHDYLGLDCTYDSWAESLQAVLNQYPSVFLTLNGHFWTTDPTTSTNRTEVGDRWQLMWNFQGVDNELGAESARILTFNLAKDTISVQTYALYENQFLTDSNNQFTISTDFRDDAAPLPAPTPTPTPTPAPTPSQTLTFPSGKILTVTSDNGESMSFTAAQILAMPTASGLGGYTQHDDADFYYTGTYVGVPVLYLCDLLGGLTMFSSVTEHCSDGFTTTLTYQEVYNATEGFSGVLFNPINCAEQNATQPMTLILAYEYNGANLPGDQGNFRIMAVGPEGLVSWGTYSGYEITSLVISVSPGLLGLPSLTFCTCDSAGIAQSLFNSGSNLYFIATGLSTSTTYSAYVVPHQAWNVGDSLLGEVSNTTITTGSSGSIAPTLIYGNAAAGQYDVILKASDNNDNQYDSQDLLLTNVVSTPGPAFVAPEYAFGALCALAACLVAFLSYATVKSGVSIQKRLSQLKHTLAPSAFSPRKARR